MPLILNNHDVQQSLDVRECLAACENAYRELTTGRAVNRPTTQTYLAHAMPNASFSFKSVEGGVTAAGVMALRIASDIVREEVASGTLRLNKLPLAHGRFVGLIELFSIETGELVAIMPDGYVQQIRVALTSALGVKYMARPESRTLGLIGTGDQARAHLRVFAATHPYSSVRVFSPNPAHRDAFVRDMASECGIPIEAVDSVRDAVEQRDIVCSATNASRPFMTGDLLEPGMHYNAIREFELDETVFTDSDVVAIHTRFGGAYHYLPTGYDTMPGVRREKPRDWSRFPDIADLVSGRAAGRTSATQTTFFLNNIGTGVQFAAVGAVALRRARELGLGHEAPSEWFTQDIKP